MWYYTRVLTCCPSKLLCFTLSYCKMCRVDGAPWNMSWRVLYQQKRTTWPADGIAEAVPMMVSQKHAMQTISEQKDISKLSQIQVVHFIQKSTQSCRFLHWFRFWVEIAIGDATETCYSFGVVKWWYRLLSKVSHENTLLWRKRNRSCFRSCQRNVLCPCYGSKIPRLDVSGY